MRLSFQRGNALCCLPMTLDDDVEDYDDNDDDDDGDDNDCAE